MKEGLRRVVRVISLIAWFSLVAGIATGIAVFNGRNPAMTYVVVGAGIAGFVLAQGVAWVIAGFSGNEKATDGLIRVASLWPKKSSKATMRVSQEGTRGVNWKAWLVGLVAWALGWTAVKYNNQPVDPVRAEAVKYFQKPENQRQFVEIMGSLNKDPNFRAALQEAKSGDAMQIGAKLAERGLPMLPDFMLLQRTYIYSQLLERSDVALCARVVRGSANGTDHLRLMSILETLPANDVGDWLRLSRAAMEAALKKNQQKFIMPAAQAEEALRLATAQYTMAQREDLFSFFSSPASLSDAAACQVGRDLYKAARGVPSEKRAFVARMLVAD